MSKNQLSLLIPDAENYLVINILNCLNKVDGISIYLMTTQQNGMQYSRHIKNISVYPPTNDKTNWIKNINKEVLRYDIDIIMPVHDDGVADLIENQSLIVNGAKVTLLPSSEAYRIATNKGLFDLHLKENDIPSPKTSVLKRDAVVSGRFFNVPFPFIIKPSANSHGGHGVVLIETENELNAYMATYKRFDEFVIQEYFEGEDWGCSVLCLNGVVKAYTLQRTMIHEKNKFSPAVGVELIHNKRVLLVVEKLLKSLSWSGVAHIDIRYNRDENKFVIIELNARYWGSIQASAVGGIIFPYLHILLSVGRFFPLPSYNTIQFIKLRGLYSTLKKNRWFLFNFKFLNSNTELGALLSDPMPTVFRTVSYIRRSFSNSINGYS